MGCTIETPGPSCVWRDALGLAVQHDHPAQQVRLKTRGEPCVGWQDDVSEFHPRIVGLLETVEQLASPPSANMRQFHIMLPMAAQVSM